MPDRKPHDAQPPRIARTRVTVDDGLLRRAATILQTRSDAETVAGALDLTVFRDEVTHGIQRMAGTNSIRDIYEGEG